MNPDEGYVDANGIRLHYLRWRRADGSDLPPIVLLHATGFLARLWQPVAEALAGRFDVFAYDTRGHGDSDKPEPGARSQEPGDGEGPGATSRKPGDGEEAGDRSQKPADAHRPYHWQNLVDDLRGFCDALGLGDVTIAGHSSGGAAAAYLAATHPEYVSRLVLFEPIILPAQFAPPEDRRNDLAEAARKRRLVWRDAEEIIEAYRARPVFERWREEMLRLYAEHGTFRREDGQIELKCPGEIEAELFEHSRSLDTWERLKITCPALVIHGGLTPEPFPSLMAQLAQRIPGARLEIVPEAGHLAPMERPQAIAEAILAFTSEAA